MNVLWVILLQLSQSAFAEGGSGTTQFVGFEEIWAQVKKTEPSLQAESHELQAAEVQLSRFSRHWYPRLLGTGRAFTTNDSIQNFVLTLGQREVQASDFAPSVLNEPGSHFFEQATLTLDLPVYEGGMRVAQVHASEVEFEARKWQSEFETYSRYTETVQAYASLLAFAEEQNQLQDLLKAVEAVIRRYHVGSRSNPIGYSGILGLKNFKNRVQGMMAQANALTLSNQAILVALAGSLPSHWEPKPDRVKTFLTKIWPDSVNGSLENSARIPAAAEIAAKRAQGAEYLSDMEAAKFLPRLGLFAQGDLYSGSRDTNTGYTAGVYLQWELLSLQNFGSIGQAEQQSAAAKSRAEALVRKLKADSESSRAKRMAAEESLKLLDESSELMREQTRTADGLFQSGSINALQLVEVFNRRADLISNRRDLELMLVQSQANWFLSTVREVTLHE